MEGQALQLLTYPQHFIPLSLGSVSQFLVLFLHRTLHSTVWSLPEVVHILPSIRLARTETLPVRVETVNLQNEIRGAHFKDTKRIFFKWSHIFPSQNVEVKCVINVKSPLHSRFENFLDSTQ